MGRVDLASAAADRAAAVADSARTERERLTSPRWPRCTARRPAPRTRPSARSPPHDPRDRMAVRIVGLNCITQGNYRGGIDIARRSLAADPGEPQFETMLGFFLEQSGYNDEGLEMELALAGARPDQPLHVPRGRPRLSGARRLPPRGGDVLARDLARALRAPPLAPRRGAGDPRPRAPHPRLLGGPVARPAALRAHRAPVAPGVPAPRADGRRGLARPRRAGRPRPRARGLPDHLDAPLDRPGLRARRRAGQGRRVSSRGCAGFPKGARAATGRRWARPCWRASSRSSPAIWPPRPR